MVKNWDVPSPVLTTAEQTQDDPLQVGVDASKIKYNVFRKGSSRGTIVYSTNVAALKRTTFDPSLESVYIIHGWTNNNSSSINKSIRDALLKKYDVNIIVVDWSLYSRLDYISSQIRVVAVRDYISSIKFDCVDEKRLKPATLYTLPTALPPKRVPTGPSSSNTHLINPHVTPRNPVFIYPMHYPKTRERLIYYLCVFFQQIICFTFKFLSYILDFCFFSVNFSYSN